MRIWNSEHTFNHNWETVVTAAWRKYPNPHNPGVVGVDTLSRTIDERGRLNSHRLLATSWGIPSLVTKMIGMQETCFANEHSTVDPEAKTFSLRTKNVTLANVLTVDEQLTYSQHPSDPNKTILKQEAIVTVQGLPLCSKLETMMTDAMSNNANKGRQAMEWVIETIKKEAKDMAVEAQKCMDNVLPQIKKEAKDMAVEAQKCMDNVLPQTTSL